MRTKEEIYIVNIDTGSRIAIQWVPSELHINPIANLSAIMTASRNLPIYHYNGGESTLQFSLDWLTSEGIDATSRCKEVESMCFSDGYNNPPPLLSIIWGASDVFKNNTYRMVSAPYKLSRFRADLGLSALTATQEITLKRVSTHNLSHAEIKGFPNLELI